MAGYREVYRCKECGKIYENGIPYICQKCGTEIGTETPIILQALGYKEATLTNNCEKVIAKKTLFGWKVKRQNTSEGSESDDSDRPSAHTGFSSGN